MTEITLERGARLVGLKKEAYDPDTGLWHYVLRAEGKFTWGWREDNPALAPYINKLLMEKLRYHTDLMVYRNIGDGKSSLSVCRYVDGKRADIHVQNPTEDDEMRVLCDALKGV